MSIIYSNFWDLEVLAPASKLACIDSQDRSLTYEALSALIDQVSAILTARAPRLLGFIFSTNSVEWLSVYLGSLRAGHVPLLLPLNIEPTLFERLVDTYQPDWIWRPSMRETKTADYTEPLDLILKTFEWRQRGICLQLHPELGLLLSTSGSTGSPKLVRLSYNALSANASSIVSYLDIKASDRAMTTLPPNYSYGLSVINSHLAAGAAVVMNNTTLMSRDFLRVVQQEQVTTLSGVPTWYQMLLRTGFNKADVPSLRVLTQAGGKLDERTKLTILNFAQAKGLRFFVMYGQTEASPRMSFVPPEALSAKLNSIGIPIPGGKLELDRLTSELIYSGPNVMMGYAESRQDLEKGDELGGVLRTGDIGLVDEHGFFSITGRLSRFVKLSGNRYGLDGVEEALSMLTKSTVAVAGRDERLGIWIESSNSNLQTQVSSFLMEKYGLHHSLFRIYLVTNVPLLQTGKKNYTSLLKLLG